MGGRAEEIAELKAIAEGDCSCLLIVYGRGRIGRIGKTFLARAAFKRLVDRIEDPTMEPVEIYLKAPLVRCGPPKERDRETR